MFCGHCGGKIREDDVFCIECGKQMGESKQPHEQQSDAHQEVDIEMKACQICANKYGVEFDACPQCEHIENEKIQTEGEALETQEESLKGMGCGCVHKLIIFIISVVITVVVGNIINPFEPFVPPPITPSHFEVRTVPEVDVSESNYENPFDLSVWGETNVIQLGEGNSIIDVPIPPGVEISENESVYYWIKDFGLGYENMHILAEDIESHPLLSMEFMEEAIAELSKTIQSELNVELYNSVIYEKDGRFLARLHLSEELFQFVVYEQFFRWNSIIVEVSVGSASAPSNPRVSEEVLKAYGIMGFYDAGMLQEDVQVDTIAESPFNFDVWGSESTVQVSDHGLVIDVPIPSGVEVRGQGDNYFYILEEGQRGWYFIDVSIDNAGSEIDSGNFHENAMIELYYIKDWMLGIHDVIEVNYKTYELEDAILAIIDIRYETGIDETNYLIIHKYQGAIVSIRAHFENYTRRENIKRAYGFDRFVEVL